LSVLRETGRVGDDDRTVKQSDSDTVGAATNGLA